MISNFKLIELQHEFLTTEVLLGLIKFFKAPQNFFFIWDFFERQSQVN